MHERAHWLEWAHTPCMPTGDTNPALADVPAMQRRRLSRLGRLAVAAASEASRGAVPGELPIVWASRYGDASRSLGMVMEVALGEHVSPTAFAVSVHNGIGAQYSIIKSVTQNATSLAANACTVEAGIIESVSLLAEGYPEVLLVHYDAPLPAPYDRFHDCPMAEYAWAIRVAKTAGKDSHGLCSLSMKPEPAPPDTKHTTLPPGLEVLRFLLTGQPYLRHRPQGGCWYWAPAHA